jgi:hypothetical protein
MPGIFESLKRMAQGKPVFDPNDDNAGWSDKNGNAREVVQSEAQQQAAKLIQKEEKHSSIVKGQPSTFPVVVVKRTRTQLSGSNQTVYCSIVNRFNESVEVEEIHLAGGSRRIGGFLRPGEEREWLCYSGSRSKYENNKEATLTYKVHESGDYFQTFFDVEYQFQQADQTYSVEELHWRQQIRDI